MPCIVESASLEPAYGNNFVASGEDMWLHIYDFHHGSEIGRYEDGEPIDNLTREMRQETGLRISSMVCLVFGIGSMSISSEYWKWKGSSCSDHCSGGESGTIAQIRIIEFDGRIKLHIWDIAGQERFRTITTVGLPIETKRLMDNAFSFFPHDYWHKEEVASNYEPPNRTAMQKAGTGAGNMPNPVHNLNVPYEGTEEYKTPTTDLLFPLTPLQTPMQTPLPRAAQTPFPGTTPTPLYGGDSGSMYNIPTGGTPITPNEYTSNNENGSVHEVKAR